MPTLQQVEQHASVVDDLTTAAIADLVEMWREFDLSDAEQTRRNLTELIDALTGSYGGVAMEIAVDWYDSLREFANVSSRYNADGVELPTVERIQALAGWATQPLRAPEVGAEPVTPLSREADAQRALSRVSGGMQRILADIDRDVTEANATRDPADVRWARHASANACAFCALLATREGNWLYRSRQSATRVVTTRGSRTLGERYHDWCRCVAVPVWAGEDYEEAPYVQQWREAYINASADTGDLTKILATMREIAGLR